MIWRRLVAATARVSARKILLFGGVCAIDDARRQTQTYASRLVPPLRRRLRLPTPLNKFHRVVLGQRLGDRREVPDVRHYRWWRVSVAPRAARAAPPFLPPGGGRAAPNSRSAPAKHFRRTTAPATAALAATPPFRSRGEPARPPRPSTTRSVFLLGGRLDEALS